MSPTTVHRPARPSSIASRDPRLSSNGNSFVAAASAMSIVVIGIGSDPATRSRSRFLPNCSLAAIPRLRHPCHRR